MSPGASGWSGAAAGEPWHGAGTSLELEPGVHVDGEAAMTPVAKSELLRQLHFGAPRR